MRAENRRATSSPIDAVVDEVAAQEGVAPEELNPPLYDVIDPEALDALFHGETGHVSFEYQGYVVTVNHPGNVTLVSTGTE